MLEMGVSRVVVLGPVSKRSAGKELVDEWAPESGVDDAPTGNVSNRFVAGVEEAGAVVEEAKRSGMMPEALPLGEVGASRVANCEKGSNSADDLSSTLGLRGRGAAEEEEDGNDESYFDTFVSSFVKGDHE